MKKAICILLMLTILCMLFVACSASDNPEEEVSEDEQQEGVDSASERKEEATGETKINFITWRAEDADVLKEMIAMFEAENPDIKVNLEITSSDMTEYYTILKSRLVSNEGADVFHCHAGPYLDQLVKAGYCKDLTDTGLADLYEPEFLEIDVIDDKLYGLLQTYNSFAIFYNLKIFDELGLQKPTSYADVVNAAKVSADAGYMPIAAGFAEAWTTSMLYEQMMANYVPDDPMVFRKLETGEAKLTDEPYVTMMTDLATMVEDGLFQKNAMGTKYDASLSLFAMGEASMLITGTWSVGGLKEMDETLEFGLFSMPGVNVPAVGIISPSQSICVNAKSANDEAAMKFTEYLSSIDAGTFYCEQTKQAPTVKGVTVASPELSEVSKLMEGDTVMLADSYVQDPRMVSIMDEVSALILGGEDVKTSLEEGQRQIDALIAENQDEQTN